mgnify:CR=1 FL=1
MQQLWAWLILGFAVFGAYHAGCAVERLIEKMKRR